MRWLLVLLFLLAAFGESKTQAASTGKPASLLLQSGGLVLTEKSEVSVKVQLGEASCSEGLLLLETPALRVEPEASILPAEMAERLIGRYDSSPKTINIGTYERGSKLVFEIIPSSSLCSGTAFFSDDWRHARIEAGSLGCYQISWEDYTDSDYNDVFLQVCTSPPVAKQTVALESDPTYRVPWQEGAKTFVKQAPGQKGSDHENRLAWDFVPKNPDVLASAAGTVLWVEDRFGPGSCSRKLYNAANVIVIQTERDVNTVYLHLKADSARVKPGQKVKQGEKIAEIGNSGYVCSSFGSTGTHLHFEIQHHCRSSKGIAKVRGEEGEPNGSWFCTPYDPATAFTFLYHREKIELESGEWLPKEEWR
ncbi:MAG: M23 family metallopeptidase [bacterium]|nr:M23 family metallopeptidase [bacterium]